MPMSQVVLALAARRLNGLDDFMVLLRSPPGGRRRRLPARRTDVWAVEELVQSTASSALPLGVPMPVHASHLSSAE